SGGRVRLRAGTLYAALDRLRAGEVIDVDREEVVEGRLRRYYRLTPKGARLLAAEAERLQANAAAARSRVSRARGQGCMAAPGWSAATGGCWPGIRGDSGASTRRRCWLCCWRGRGRASGGPAWPKR